MPRAPERMDGAADEVGESVWASKGALQAQKAQATIPVPEAAADGGRDTAEEKVRRTGFDGQGVGKEHLREGDFEVGSYVEVSLLSKTESQRERSEWETQSLGCGQGTDGNANQNMGDKPLLEPSLQWAN